MPTARPRGSVILLPAEIQGNSPPWQWTQGKRKRDKEGHTRQLVSEGMLSCYLTEEVGRRSCLMFPAQQRFAVLLFYISVRPSHMWGQGGQCFGERGV